jgi:hypothetical protein
MWASMAYKGLNKLAMALRELCHTKTTTLESVLNTKTMTLELF